MSDIQDSSNQPPSGQPNKPRPNRKRYRKEGDSSQPASTSNGRGEQNAQASLTSGTPTSTDNTAPTKQHRDRRGPKQQNASNQPSRTGPDPSKIPQGGQGRRKRGAKFNASLTDPSSTDAASPKPQNDSRKDKKLSKPKGDDLTSTLTYALSTPPYPDCPICFIAIYPVEPTWSCSPPRFDLVDENREENASSQCCWTTFHLKCIRSWAGKSVKELVDAWRARGENRNGEWRCPGCQSRRETVPNGYRCFCGSTTEPKPPRLATPHSCANPCTRPRRGCQHPCSLACHPGPCPPCQVTIQLPCYCRKHVQSIRCANLVPGSSSSSCGEVCGQKLGCGSHACGDVCHPGECAKCGVKDLVRCYCGKVEKEVPCGEGEEKECFVDGENGWTGRFQCDNKCDRLLDCGEHICSKPCHPPSSIPPPCPRSPSLVTHCPCGKHVLDPSSASEFPPNAIISRTLCSDPIPTCNSICMRPLDGCSHVCSAKCHTGPCPPCTIMLVRPCRCGATTRDIQCSSVGSGSDNEILCDKACTALRTCGHHQCNRLCCPLASLAAANTKSKGKKKGILGAAEGESGLHECDLVCGKMLGCGSHQCEERDHRGPCPPCLRSSFEEMVCYCGRTVLDPPIPCGTRINCTYPCSRPLLSCGHPKTPHSCHEDPTPCPPCPFLTDKLCACGKRTVANVLCLSEKVSCGAKCGKLLECGFHHCERLCHGDDCGACTSTCGKSRKLCLPSHHPCTLPCHAPSTCLESEPCCTTITLTCPCGRIRQSVLCGKSVSNAGREATQQVKCSNDCLIAKRNARLAEALGINPETKEKPVSYSDELTAFGRMNLKFVGLVEKSFSDFVGSEKKTQVLPHMPMEKRKFVYELASVYRMDAQMVDQEPHRSVQLIRRIDTRIPSPLLSSTITPSGPRLGKLADLRAPAATQSSRPPPPRVTTPVGSSGRDWTSVVARSTFTSNPVPPGSSGSSGSWRTHGTGKPSAPRPLAAAAIPSPPTTVEANSADIPDNWEDDT